MVVGGVAVALSQVFPIVQMMAGLVGFAVAKRIGVPVDVRDGGMDWAAGPPNADTVVAGFVVTMITGGLLLLASIAAGLAIRAVLSLRRDCRT